MLTDPKEKRIKQIQQVLETRETEDLLAIWTNNNHEAWTDEAFIAIQRILMDRQEGLPPQTGPQQGEGLPGPDSLDSQTREPQERDMDDLLRTQEESKIELERDFYYIQGNRHLELAVNHVKNDELELALHECDQAIQFAPRLTHAHNYRGMILEEMGDLEGAVEAYGEAVRIDPEFRAARKNYHDARIKLDESQHPWLKKNTIF